MLRSLAVLAVLACVTALPADEKGQDVKADSGEKSQPAEEGHGLMPRVKLETTLGDIVLELNGEKAPISTQNFLTYVDEGYYEGTIFHRVISTFMIQGGGFTEEMEQKKEGLHPPIKNEWRNGLKNERGTIAMARTAAPDSATAQFFINVVDNAFLDQPRGGAAYAVFGKVVEGMDTVDKIRDAEVIRHPKYPSRQAVTPKTAVVIESAEIVRECDRKELAEKALEAEKRIAVKRERAEEEQMEAVEKDLEQAEKKAREELGKEVKKTASGMRYLIIEEGSGEAPPANATVMAHYTGWFVDGRKFDSSHDRGEPLPVNLARPNVIPGWIEALKLMPVGAKWRIILPPDLAYGKRGHPAGIPPNSVLVFDIESVRAETDSPS